MLIQMKVLNIPGWKNSRAGHWQTIWEADDPQTFSRIEQDEWLNPQKADWVKRIGETLSHAGSDVIVTAHSIGVTAFLHAVHEYNLKVKGALLVAPSDPEHPDCIPEIKNFSPIPRQKLPLPAIVVARSDDPGMDYRKISRLVVAWRCTLNILESAGHIEPKSGFGKWPEGRRLLKRFFEN